MVKQTANSKRNSNVDSPFKMPLWAKHMRSGRQSLTQRYVHSFARRDYTAQELQLDRALRKQAGDLNAREGKLNYVERDFEIVKLRNPRELPRRSLASPPPHPAITMRVTRSRSQQPALSTSALSSQNSVRDSFQSTSAPLLTIA
ncbi:hypothetical protein ANCCAN_19097 [Ancylostoma caninum]|uniref:Uncharacterized protein n=1 Tax=Ancylostoma caninum TaxID=29170 RepID=A0A368FSC0_ANCCA|nr:hypothetical protein ANCCAN_19097 [Ancylostoma caninum]